ncbi:major facilitator superfamily domain-containing protein [Xylaria sp. FL1042]|nr:major facilitator superfamily domain-containing protein [Xylaria sp. FL1042]
MTTDSEAEKQGEVITAVVTETVMMADAVGPQSVGDDQSEVRRTYGVHDYLKVVGLFFVYFITLGQVSSFSTYQDYYQEILLNSYSASTISWIGTSQVFLLGIVGLLSGAMYDRGYMHEALLPGFVLLILGLLLLSFSHLYWHILLSQGFLIGIGGALFYIPAISIVSNNFAPRPALPLGIAASGSAVGGIIWPIVFRSLLPRIGFGWVNRVFTLLVLVLSVVSYYTLISGSQPTHSNFPRRKCAGLLKFLSRHATDQSTDQSTVESSIEMPDHPKSEKLTIVASVFNGRAYQFLCVGVFFALLGYWVPLFYLVPFASLSLGTSPTYASYLQSILNAASLFGRILPAAVGHKLGAANILLVGATTLSILVFAWISIDSVAGITVWVVFLGFTTGSVITIPNAVASRLSQPSNTGLRIGNMWAVGAFAELIGPPIGGALLMERDGKTSYLGCQLFGALSVVIGAAFLVVPAWSILKEDRSKKLGIDDSFRQRENGVQVLDEHSPS